MTKLPPGPRTREERLQCEAAEAVLREAGLAWTYRRARHLVCIVEGRSLTIASTPRDVDAAIGFARQNAQRFVRLIEKDRHGRPTPRP